jgi:protein-disulfide isomerase
MDHQVRAQLKALVDQYGPSLGSDARRLESLLRDTCPDQRKEINALVAAAKERIPSDLLSNGHRMLPAVLVQRLRDLGLEAEVSTWAVESWAFALNITWTSPGTPITQASSGYRSPAPPRAQQKHFSPSDDSVSESIVHPARDRVADLQRQRNQTLLVITLVVLALGGAALALRSRDHVPDVATGDVDAGQNPEILPSPPSSKTADGTKPAAGSAGDPADTVYRIPIGNAAVRGSSDAKVTIVEFSDFECPFCQRAFQTVKKVEETYGDNVRIAYKQNPLPFHSHAHLAAEAALAAGEQGRFWQMHDLLFTNREHLERADLERYAGELNLSMSAFKGALDSHKFNDQIIRDQAEASRFGAQGTPHFFINGRRLVGAQPFESFKAIIDEQLRRADELIRDGTAPSAIYDALTRHGMDHATQPQPGKGSTPTTPQAAQARIIEESKLASAMARGTETARVTIVEWGDFQCPYCGRAWQTVDKVLKEYPKDVRFFFMHEPLPFHPNAMPAAIAATAAGNQGKFWEFYDIAFQHQQELSPSKYEQWARQLQLNVGKFERDIDDPATRKRVEDVAAFGRQVGANGTPTFFVNGREVAGALPYETFKQMIDEEIKRADELLKKGTPRSGLYAALNEYNVKNAPKPSPQPGDDGKPVHIDVGDAPVRGTGRVEIIEFSDFQCPFCGRVEPTIARIMDRYKGKVRLVWKNQPLPFHVNARPAAKAALAAAEQGRFWEMHDKLFANQTQLSLDNYVAWARDLSLNIDKFKADMASATYDAILDADSKQGRAVGASGTPTFFINGHKIVGAQPIENFEKMIDDALAGKL